MPLLTTRAGASSRAFGFGAGATETTSYVLLASTTVTSGTSLTISSIPSGYMGYTVFLRATSASGQPQVSIEPRTSGGASSTYDLTKGMTGQSWGWNWESQGSLTLNSNGITSNARNHIDETYYNFVGTNDTSGLFRESRWGGSGEYVKFGGGTISKSSGTSDLSSIYISLYEYPSTPPFSFCQVYLYGIKSA